MICNMSYLAKALVITAPIINVPVGISDAPIINVPVGISHAPIINVPVGIDNETINLADVEIILDHSDKKRKLKCKNLSFLIVSY